jgi:SsrA-binding protein
MTKPEIVNRRAKFEYHFLDKYEAGIQLSGPEVKSLRLGNANINDAYCFFRNMELFIRNMYIAEYNMASTPDYQTRGDRKLLLRREELRKLERKSQEKGLTIIPYKIYFNERGFVKIGLALAQGKKIHDKRESIKAKDQKRELERLSRKKF